MRLLTALLLIPGFALAQGPLIHPQFIFDFVTGNFGDGIPDGKAMLVNDDEGFVDLYVFDSRFLVYSESGFDVLHVPEITSMVKYPPGLALTYGGGFEISQTQSVMGWGTWTNTDKIAYLDGDYLYVGRIFEFTRGIPPFDSITCEYDYEYGVVEVLAINEDEEITLMEEHPINPAQSDYVDPKYAGIVYEVPEIVTELCNP